MKFVGKPPFRFVGNKGNRRFLMLDVFRKFSSSVTSVCDMFGGSLYCSHVASYVRWKDKLEYKIFTNDYDNYSSLFSDEFFSLLQEMYDITQKTLAPRNGRLEPEICAEIDALIAANPKYAQFLKNYTSIYGNIEQYYNRVWVPKYLTLDEYVSSEKIFHLDYLDYIDAIKDADPDGVHLWVCDPPYHTTKTRVNYKGKKDVPLESYCEKIFKMFPSDIIFNFSYIPEINIDGCTAELADRYTQLPTAVTSHEHYEYAHIIRKVN